MAIQWSLVLFTVLTGAGGWMLACVAIDEFAGRTRGVNKLAVVVAAVVACIGGIASVTHLSHPEHIMGALSHPTSGIFTEAALTGLLAVCAVVYFVLLVRGASAGARKAFAVLGAVFGVALSFMAGESVAGGVVAAVTAAAYGAVSGAGADQPLLLWGLAVVVGGVAPAVLGGVALKKPEQAFALACATALCALVGATAYRCVMWLASAVVNNFFGML